MWSVDASTDHIVVRDNSIYDTRVTELQRGASFDATATNVNYGGNDLSNLVVGNWLNDLSVNSKGYTRKGTTANRPTGLGDGGDDVGQNYLDTTLAVAGKPIKWTGSAWVDGLGASV